MSKQTEQITEGYNPIQYRMMTIVFLILSFINIATVILAFARTGYGLYHAEDALSHVSKITQYVQNINESALNIVIHNNEDSIIVSEIQNINQWSQEMEKESDEYLEINLNEIDPKLQSEFESAYKKVHDYQKVLNAFNADLSDRIRSDLSDPNADMAFIRNAYALDIEPLKSEAATAMNNVFELQNQSTYDFFVRSAQQFLFVLLFLFITMTAGLIGIRKMKKHARQAAEAIALEHKNAISSRNKVIDIAYSNILTGFKNRYGLEDDLTDLLAKKNFTIAVCNYNHFSSVNEAYGREVADKFISTVSQQLAKEYDQIASIYSTDTDEFCFVFKEHTATVQIEKTVQQIARTLSRPVEVGEVTIQLTASCCYYQCTPGAKNSFNGLLRIMDRAMFTAKEESKKTGQSAVINVNYLK
ncbi:MAG TPA: hypothetical protein DCG49_03605 [Ruminococcus sp.]|nr:hypothetical protein [Ruminococcus sp.]